MKKILIAWAFIVYPLLGQAQFNAQPKRMTEKFFPDSKIPIGTPAFKKDSGYTNYKEMTLWLDSIIKPHGEKVKRSFIGKSQKGKQIVLLKLTNPNNQPKTKVWLQGGLHGDEPAGTESLLYLIDKLLNDSQYSYLLNKLEVAIVPMANIDGYEKHRRESANGIDLNRDQTRFSAPESRALKQAFSAFQAEVAMDLHEYRPFRKDFSRFSTRGISSYYDAMFLYTGNLNVPEQLRTFTRNEFVIPAQKALSDKGFRYQDYITTQKYGGKVQFNVGSIHSRSSATSFALSNCVSTLLEIRGVGIRRTSFKRRIETTFIVVSSYLKSAYEKQNQVKEVINNSIDNTNDIVVTSRRRMYKDELQAIDIATNEVISIPVTLHNALQSQAVLTRKRPGAYIIMPNQLKAIQNLKLMGLVLDSLTDEKQLEVVVESYYLKEQDAETAGDEEDDEGITGNTSGDEKTVEISFPKGTYILYLNQRCANLACEVLEPENPNSFLAMKVIKVHDFTMLPVYRYMKTEKIQH
jgi:Zinc carboxypeptidase